MMSVRQPSPQRAVKPGRLGWVCIAAFAVALMMAGAAMAQGGMSKSTERLFDAVFKNDMTAVKASIPAGADLDAVNSWGQTPADLAVDLGYFEIAHFLTSLRQFEKREEQESPPSTASSFFDPQFTPPSALEPLSPSAPTPAPEPAPPPLPGGAFDPSIASQGSVLSVIGDIRGPERTAVPEAMTPSPAPSPLPAAGAAAKPAVKGVPTAAPKPGGPPSPTRPVAAVRPTPSPVQPAAPASPGEPMAAAPAQEEPGFISNLWGQLADAFSDEPEEVAEAPAPADPSSAAEPVAAAPEDEGAGFISNMLGQLKDAFSAAPKAESAKEPIVAFSEAKPSALPAAPASPGEGASVDEKPGAISNMLGQLTETMSTAPGAESAKEPVVAFSEAKPSEAAKKAPKSKPKFSDRLAKFLSLDNEPPPRVKKRRRRRAVTETAMVRFPMPTRSSEFLKGVGLNLSGAPDLGKPAPSIESCISKNRGRVLFCIEPVAWPELLRPYFQVNTYMYSGAKSIVRYDDGKATFVHVLFPSDSFETVLDHFERRFGPPTDQQELWLISLSSPARSNPMAAWWSIEGSSVTSLQVRKYDDTRGGFPDMEYGAISLHIQGAKPIFPLLSTANLMLLKFKKSP